MLIIGPGYNILLCNENLKMKRKKGKSNKFEEVWINLLPSFVLIDEIMNHSE
jgi:hypothetical protein